MFELSEFLVHKLGVEDVGAYLPAPGDVPPDLPLAADAPGGRRARCGCSRAVRGIDLVELPQAEECCGFGGTFAVKNADTSMAMLGDKIRCVLDTRAEFCAAADNSCLMHIGGALHRQRAGVGPIHLAEILASTEDDAPSRAGRPMSRTSRPRVPS